VQRPDKWDEIAVKMYEEVYWAFDMTTGRYLIAQALRDAEKAGMERAAVIADMFEDDEGRIARAIRAAKETKP
jgi:hypothetical protein